MTLFESLKSISPVSKINNDGGVIANNKITDQSNYGINGLSGYDVHRIPGYSPQDYFETTGFGKEGYVGPKSC
ncbi:hypothetical protein DDB_G0289267 [Dictyostelium discoideum AX4]|uniref:Uncharacterized protein n=1 Tax=Dictyostelium discoideum TaxID=44689 RepID=Q54HR8_DICDI|nr:hypothetical protein DDB_G0289267 [Dictyostelium discoideum AX4]EAL62805.1 hypothetical protein DDB_G0289267 [Dictyostelium discoideum AX4]|eukprot:XP_636318.1 hypothetical protein DDB_G0289267 [Dictyostelium discoideum AX4]